ncbi:hypothetical protein ACS0TY_035338 [Phlomoides rotata]
MSILLVDRQISVAFFLRDVRSLGFSPSENSVKVSRVLTYRSRLWVSCVMATSEDRGDDVLDLGMVEGSTRERGSSFFWAGQLCTSMLFNVFALMDVMERAFKSRTKAVDRDWVIWNQPWHFDGNLFMGKLLSGSEQPSIVTISKGSFSTRAYDIPIMYQMEATLISIVSRVGAMEVFEPPDDNNLGSYLCFKAVVDITKPLVRGLKIRVNGDDIWVPIKYELLPSYCFYCGVIGHSFKFCENYDHNDCPDPAEMEFGPWNYRGLGNPRKVPVLKRKV